MNCPKCGSKTDVIAVQTSKDGKIRKRRCLECGYGFFTKELVSKSAELQYKVADSDRHRKEESNEGS